MSANPPTTLPGVPIPVAPAPDPYVTRHGSMYRTPPPPSTRLVLDSFNRLLEDSQVLRALDEDLEVAYDALEEEACHETQTPPQRSAS